MGERKRKNNWWKWVTGAAVAGAVIFGGIMAFIGGNNAVQTGVSVTPTAIVAEATSTVTPEPSPSPSATNTPTVIPTEAVTVTPEPTVTETPTPEPTEEPTPTPTEEAMPTDTVTPTQIPTNTPTVMPTVSPKPTATPTVKPAATPTVTPKPTDTPMEAPTLTVAPTSTPTAVPTNTPTPTPAAWAEPRERKDIADLLMGKVNEYRVSKGMRRWESPFVYHAADDPELGEWLSSKGLRVAKKCCMEHSANHEGYQIGTGVYFYPWQVTDIWKDEMVQTLFNSWYNSPAHNKNMLYDGGGEDEWVGVAIMTVTEHFDGEYWHYCAIMTITFVYKEDLPDGLE